MELSDYKLDEKQAMLNHALTQKNIDTSPIFRAQVLSGTREHIMAEFKAINDYGKTCLAVGCADGPQFFGLRKFFPEVKWEGCEISQNYIDLFATALIAEGVVEGPKVTKITDYKDLSIYKDGSFEVVSSCSTLNHYSPEHGFEIINEMIRVCSKAVVIKFHFPPEEVEDMYVEGYGNMEGRGYIVHWSKAKWNNFIKDKKCSLYLNYVYVIEK